MPFKSGHMFAKVMEGQLCFRFFPLCGLLWSFLCAGLFWWSLPYTWQIGNAQCWCIVIRGTICVMHDGLARAVYVTSLNFASLAFLPSFLHGVQVVWGNSFWQNMNLSHTCTLPAWHLGWILELWSFCFWLKFVKHIFLYCLFCSVASASKSLRLRGEKDKGWSPHRECNVLGTGSSISSCPSLQALASERLQRCTSCATTMPELCSVNSSFPLFSLLRAFVSLTKEAHCF